MQNREAALYSIHKTRPMNIDIAMVNKFYDLTVMQPTVPDSLRSHYALLERRASECVGCQSCSA